MIYADWAETNILATKQKGMFSVYVSNGLEYNETDSKIWDTLLIELSKVYGIDTKTYYATVGYLVVGGLLFFKTEEEAWTFCNIFNKEGIYSSAVYASLCSPIDGCLTENT